LEGRKSRGSAQALKKKSGKEKGVREMKPKDPGKRKLKKRHWVEMAEVLNAIATEKKGWDMGEEF